MSLYWQNKSPRTGTFTQDPNSVPRTNYTGIPQFIRISGVTPGQPPVTGSVVAPSPFNMKRVLSSLPSIFSRDKK